jgi:hypothetical protein
MKKLEEVGEGKRRRREGRRREGKREERRREEEGREEGGKRKGRRREEGGIRRSTFFRQQTPQSPNRHPKYRSTRTKWTWKTSWPRRRERERERERERREREGESPSSNRRACLGLFSGVPWRAISRRRLGEGLGRD